MISMDINLCHIVFLLMVHIVITTKEINAKILIMIFVHIYILILMTMLMELTAFLKIIVHALKIMGNYVIIIQTNVI